MKKYFFSFLLSLISILSFSQDWDWTKVAGGPAVDRITGMAHDLTGNLFITGYFDSVITFDSTRLVSAGGTDVFIAKYDADGVLLWARQVGGQNDDYASAISTDLTGNCYLTGFFFIQGTVTSFGSTSVTNAGDADMFISKFTAAGNLLWVRNGGSRGEDASFGIATDVAGNSYICGYFSGTAMFSNVKVNSVGYTDIFISKYDAAGNLVWIRTGGGSYQDEAYAISTDIAGNCYVTGYFTGNASFGGINLASAGYFDTDVFLIKYNPSGTLAWAKRAGGTANDIGYGVEAAPNGSIYVDGVFYGTKTFGETVLSRVTGSNGFLVKFESNGKTAWVKGTNGSGTNEFKKVSTDANSNCYVAGTISNTVSFGKIELTSAGGKDACVAKYDPKGTLMWVLQGGGPDDDEGMNIAADKAGNCYFGGEYNTSASFGRLKFSGWNLQDIFISRIK